MTNERRRALFRKLLGGLQVAAALGLLFLIVVLLAGTLPSLLGYESFVVYSGSMEPAMATPRLSMNACFPALTASGGSCSKS